MHMIASHPRPPVERVPEGFPATMPASGPPPVWVAVLAAAGYQCECESPACHTPRSGRCKATTYTEALIAAPAAPGTLPKAVEAALPASQLVAWCECCYAVKVRQIAAERESELIADQPDLFGSPLSEASVTLGQFRSHGEVNHA